MRFIFLGMLFGTFSVVVPGPVNVSLLQVGAAQGRSSGLRAGIGISGGDVFLAIASLCLVSAGASLPDVAFSVVQVASACFLIGFGLLLLSRPTAVEERFGDVKHPLRSFLLITALMPTAFGTWVAMLTAMPFASDQASLIAFAGGVVLTSVMWHPVLGVFAGVVGPRLTPQAMRNCTRAGGVATMALGIWSLLSLGIWSLPF